MADPDDDDAGAMIMATWGREEWYARFRGDGVLYDYDGIPAAELRAMVAAMEEGRFPHPVPTDYGCDTCGMYATGCDGIYDDEGDHDSEGHVVGAGDDDSGPAGSGGGGLVPRRLPAAPAAASSVPFDREETLRVKMRTLSSVDLKSAWVSAERPWFVRQLTGLPHHRHGYRGRPLACITRGDMNAANDMSAFYVGDARILARRSDAPSSPVDFWEQHAAEIVADSLEWRGGRVSLQTLAASCYYRLRQCAAFRPVVARAFYERWGARRVLDPCAGWGDRLVAACAATTAEGDPVEYVGVDPNPLLHPGYARIIADWGYPERHHVHAGPFEEVPLDDHEHPVNARGPYDMVFTSPPFFDLEVYNEDDPLQSLRHARGPTRRERLLSWKRGFLYRLLTLAWLRLRVGGRMCISLNDHRLARCVDDTVRYMARAHGVADSAAHGGVSVAPKDDSAPLGHGDLPAPEEGTRDAVFEGVIVFMRGTASGAVKPAQPIWVWHKVPQEKA